MRDGGRTDVICVSLRFVYISSYSAGKLVATPPCLLYSKANRCSTYVSGDFSLGMCYDLLYIILPYVVDARRNCGGSHSRECPSIPRRGDGSLWPSSLSSALPLSFPAEAALVVGQQLLTLRSF